jgi:glyoxylase-like metal-dependent hydrolase (beta-lactamase superfamily II)
MSAAYFDSRRVLMTGDSLVLRNPLTGRVGPQIAPAGLNRDSQQALRSLDALAGLTADVLLPGHGDPWTRGAAEAVRLAKAAGPS